MKNWIVFLLPPLLFAACQHETPTYEQLVEQELNTGIRHDSLFFGLHLGMSRSQFFDRCWELNRQGICKQGTQNMTVEHQLKTALKGPATMNFYPEFHDNKIHVMPVWFAYNNWAPWNKELSSDSLIWDVKNLLEKWYGEGFFGAQDETGHRFLIKIDGNREIRVTKALSDREVRVDFRDLSVIPPAASQPVSVKLMKLMDKK